MYQMQEFSDIQRVILKTDFSQTDEPLLDVLSLLGNELSEFKSPCGGKVQEVFI